MSRADVDKTLMKEITGQCQLRRGGTVNTISEVVENRLCTGCGTCLAVCPNSALRMYVSGKEGVYHVEVDESKCNHCGVCFDVCSGYSIDYARFNSEFFGKQPKDSMIGNYLGCYLGHVQNAQIRYDSASGGVVTQLLIFALEKGIIDGALVVRMNREKPLEAEPFIARTKEEILSASKSKYCPVPLNIALKEILGHEGRFAVVGLPCHIHGIRAAELIRQKLRDRIVLHVGLFCSHTVSFVGTEVLLRKFRIQKADVAAIAYRGMGWPGFMSIRMKDGRGLIVRFNKAWNAYWNLFSPFFFTPLRCMMCSDQFNELSDVSVGDAWLPELRRNSLGESLLITRTNMGEKTLASMKDLGILRLRSIPPSEVKESQAFSLNFKKVNLPRRFAFLRMLGQKTPCLNANSKQATFDGFLSAFFSYSSVFVSSNEHLRSLLVYVPLPLFRLYFGLFKLNAMLTGVQDVKHME